VAEVAGYIAFPRACGDAALVAAYAMQKCRELYQQQCFLGYRLSLVQREYCNAYPKVDFRFWVDVWQLVYLSPLPLTVLQRSIFQGICVSATGDVHYARLSVAIASPIAV